MLNIRCHENR